MNTKEKKNVIAGFTDENLNKYDLFEKTLAESGFFEVIDKKRAASGKEKKDFRVVIKPNITMLIRRDDDGIYTDPLLTIHLLRLLVKRGYTHLTVVESQNFYGEWFTNRAVIQVAARAGYFEEDVLFSYQGERERQIVVKGEGIDACVPLVDLTLDIIKYDFGGNVGPLDLGKTWVDADFRINFAKMKTHFYCYHTLAIKNIYGCLPLQDKIREYHCKNVLPQWTALLIREFPVDFSIIDGYTAADGMQGAKMKALSFKSHTFVAGEDILAVDHFTAGLMGQKVEKSVLYQELSKLISPKSYEVVGNATPFQGWKNPGWFYVTLTDHAQKSEKVMEILGSILTGGYDACFPMKKDERSFIRKLITFPKYIGNFISDIENVRIKYRKIMMKWFFIKHRKKIPTVSGRLYLSSRLAYLSADDIENMLPLLEENVRQPVSISGHYFLIGDKEFPFPARLAATNFAIRDILNDAIEKNIRMDLYKDLRKILKLGGNMFDPDARYPYPYQ